MAQLRMLWKNVETTVTASDCESPEWFGRQVDSKSIAPSRIGYVAHVLSQSEKRRDDHKMSVRLRMRRSRAELMLKSETVNPEHVRGKNGKVCVRARPLKLPWIARTGMASGCLRGARKESNGIKMHSQTS